MELHDWALCAPRLITKAQYVQIVQTQFAGTVSNLHFAKGDSDKEDGLLIDPNPDMLRAPLIRRHPVGDVIDHMPLAKDIYRKAGVADLNGLVAKWQDWHVSNLEPICNHSITSHFGKKLFLNKEEKKLAAWFITNVPVHSDLTPIIRQGAIVVIPDGSSAFYSGLAIAAFTKGASIITSNGPLYSEYLANPALARALSGFQFVGGCVDADQGGAFGHDVQVAYNSAIQMKPRATVVVMSVSGFLPDFGPYATQGNVAALKHSIIEDSIGPDVKEPVQELVFVTDHSKHLSKKAAQYGVPIFGQEKWQKLVEDNRQRISVVTVPPPIIRDEASKSSKMREIPMLLSGNQYGKNEKDYNTTVRALADVFYDGEMNMFHEAYSLDPNRGVEHRVGSLSISRKSKDRNPPADAATAPQTEKLNAGAPKE